MQVVMYFLSSKIQKVAVTRYGKKILFRINPGPKPAMSKEKILVMWEAVCCEQRTQTNLSQASVG